MANLVLGMGSWGVAGKFAEVKRAAQALVGHKDRIRFWTEGAGLLLDLDFLLSALEEQEEAEEAGEEGRMLEAEVGVLFPECALCPLEGSLSFIGQSLSSEIPFSL